MYAQCKARALRLTREPQLALTVHIILTPGTVEEGEYHALWARASLASVLEDDQAHSTTSSSRLEHGCSDRQAKVDLLEGTASGTHWHRRAHLDHEGGTVSGGRNVAPDLPSVALALSHGIRHFGSKAVTQATVRKVALNARPQPRSH